MRKSGLGDHRMVQSRASLSSAGRRPRVCLQSVGSEVIIANHFTTRGRPLIPSLRSRSRTLDYAQRGGYPFSYSVLLP
jgi:hypothetical protein